MPDIVYAVNDFADINRRLKEIERERERRYGGNSAVLTQAAEWNVRRFHYDVWYRCDLIRGSTFWHHSDDKAQPIHFAIDPVSHFKNIRNILGKASMTVLQSHALKRYGTDIQDNTIIVFCRLMALGVKISV